jgi:phosphoserine phosphatase RsbU/P
MRRSALAHRVSGKTPFASYNHSLMQRLFIDLRLRLDAAGLLPRTRLARLACYLLGLDLLLFLLRAFFNLFRASYGQSLGIWLVLLSFVLAILFFVLALRWVKARLLWRLRHRLIVTYVFIGVIPAVLLILMAFISLYLFAGQFANFVVTSQLNTRLQSLASANAAIAHELAGHLERKQSATAESLFGLKRKNPEWAARQACAWDGTTPLLMCGGEPHTTPISLPNWIGADFTDIVSDNNDLYLRAVARLNGKANVLTVVCSEPLDRTLLTKVAGALGEITLYAAGYGRPSERTSPSGPGESTKDSADRQDNPQLTIHSSDPGSAQSETETRLRPLFVAGRLPPASGMVDRVITFGTPLPVMDWQSGELRKASALLRVETRPSAVYAHLFAALGDFATGVEYVLLITGIVFAIIELLALWIGTRLTRSVTGVVAQIYEATKHINRGDFSHKIPIKSNDQLAALAGSFNSMTTSIQQLIEEQKAKQRLENELVIAQEVQAQLFPQHISQLESLEMHGFCRPARTVSGDYYDFLKLTADTLILAVGDVSGKGISAALLMATIHSAVRAYSLEGIPILRGALAVGAGPSSAIADFAGVEVSPGTLLSLLNHQLYMSTPAEKYATLFLGIYEERERKLTYSNAGHLPPLILSEDGGLRRLEKGGTVVGLFDGMDYQEASVPLRRGDVFLAYSDGVTEPENDFGEFGEGRLVDLVRQNRDLPLVRITEIVTAAVDDWIGAHEQPDDVTLVLARAR